MAFSKSLRGSSIGGAIFFAVIFLFGVMMAIFMSPLAIGLFIDCGPSSGGGGGGGGGAAFGGDCFGDS